MYNFRGRSIFLPICQVKVQIGQMNVTARAWTGISASDPKMAKCLFLKQSRSRLCTPSAKWGITSIYKPRIKSRVKYDDARSVIN